MKKDTWADHVFIQSSAWYLQKDIVIHQNIPSNPVQIISGNIDDETEPCRDPHIHVGYLFRRHYQSVIPKEKEFSEVNDDQEPMETVTENEFQDFDLMEKEKNEVTFICDGCDGILLTQSVLEDHKKLYCKGKERKEPSPDPAFICFACQQTFKYKKNLLEHIRNVHPSEDAPIYDCSQCPYRARAKKNLVRHIQRMHPLEDGPSYNCVECSYSTKIKEYFSEHLRNSLHMQ